MTCKSLICFCSGTPGGRVDVVESMIGCVFVDMWAFCGELGPPPLFTFLLCYVIGCWLSTRRQFFLLLEKVDFVTRRKEEDQEEEEEEEEEEEGKHLNHI